MNKYMVGVIGGACAGSEIAARLSDLGMEVVVFEQNPLPYGKIEDGLPRWHEKLQHKEESAIDGRLDRPGILFVPNCRIGYDLSIEDLQKNWHFPLVVLANGAWTDRPLKIPGVEGASPDDFIYQNNFIYWFNHNRDRNFTGTGYQVAPGPVVIGGGLAAIDVAKACMFELVNEALVERGHQVDLIDMEHKGIFKVVENLGLDYASLGIRPARIIYRKRVADMPLIPLGISPAKSKKDKAEATRQKIVNNAMRKYGFEVLPLHTPYELHHEEGRVTGVSFELMEWEDGRFSKTGKRERVETTQVISSIGSTPEALPGMPMDGEHYQWVSRFTGEISNLCHFYCVGNAITGRGNIKNSAANARRLGNVIDAGVSGGKPAYEEWFGIQAEEARAHVATLISYLSQMPATSQEQSEQIHEKVRAHWRKIGYEGYRPWREAVLSHR